MSSPATTETTLYGARLAIARVVWVSLVAMVIGLWGVGTIVLFRQPMPDCIQDFCDPIDFNAGDLEIARQEVDLNELTGEILNIVKVTIQPEHVSLWLRAPSPASLVNTRTEG